MPITPPADEDLARIAEHYGLRTHNDCGVAGLAPPPTAAAGG